MLENCEACHGAGWVLDCNPTRHPVGLELLPCLLPDCVQSGRPIAYLSVNEGQFRSVAHHPSTGFVMSIA